MQPRRERVEIPAYTDRWMMGDRMGEIVKVTKAENRERGQIDEIAHVRLDISGRTIKCWLTDCKVR